MKVLAAASRDVLDESNEIGLAVLVVDADPAFYRNRHIPNGAAHCRNACRHKLGFRHETGAEAARLHTVRRTPAIQIDLIVAEGQTDFGGARQFFRVGPAELQRDRMLDRMEAEKPLAVAMHDRR